MWHELTLAKTGKKHSDFKIGRLFNKIYPSHWLFEIQIYVPADNLYNIMFSNNGHSSFIITIRGYPCQILESPGNGRIITECMVIVSVGGSVGAFAKCLTYLH